MISALCQPYNHKNICNSFGKSGHSDVLISFTVSCGGWRFSKKIRLELDTAGPIKTSERPFLPRVLTVRFISK